MEWTRKIFVIAMTRVLKLFTRIKTCRRGLAFEYENRMNFGKQVRNCDTSGLRVRTYRSRDSTVIQEILKLWIAPLTRSLARLLTRSWARGTVEYFCPIFKMSWITVPERKLMNDDESWMEIINQDSLLGKVEKNGKRFPMIDFDGQTTVGQKLGRRQWISL